MNKDYNGSSGKLIGKVIVIALAAGTAAGGALHKAKEAITRKKVKPEVEGIIHTIGFILLMILMLYITF